MPEKNNYAFIDGQNLNIGVQSLGWKLDQRKFREYLRDQFGVSKAFYFVGFMEEQQALYSSLQDAGFIVYFKPIVRQEEKMFKGNVDADMVLEAMKNIDRYDKAVIVSGDGDFSSLVRHLKDNNKLEAVVVPNKQGESTLYSRLEGHDSKLFSYIDDLRTKLAYKDHRRSSSRSSTRKPRK